jgi:hypothetical protein
MACLHFTSWLGLAENSWVMILSVSICFAAAFAVTVIVVLPKVNKPKMSVKEKTRILETVVENNRAIEKALEDETNATKERTDYLRSLNILLQQKIEKLQAQLQDYSNSTRETQMNKTFLSQKILIVTIAAVAVMASCTRSPNVEPTPDTKWYTNNTEADTFYIATADELAGLAQIINDENELYLKAIKADRFSTVDELKMLVQMNVIKVTDTYVITADGVALAQIIKGENDEIDIKVDSSNIVSVMEAEDFSGKIIILTNDIDLSAYGSGSKFNKGKGWIPIRRFSGVFDGNNKKIRGLYINDSTLDDAGLFGVIGSVKDLGVVDVNITGKDDVGGVAGVGYGSNCYSTGTVTGKDNVGGVVGKGDVNNCYSTGTVTGKDNVGGVVGSGTVSNCYSTGTVRGENNVGGVAGASTLMNSDSISNCYSTGTVNGKNDVGGVVGSMKSFSRNNVTNCYFTGTVKGKNNIGGVFGTAEGSYDGEDGVVEFVTVINSYSTGTVSGENNVGGVAGKSSESHVTNSYSTGTVSGENNVGGVAGIISESHVTNSYSTSTVSGKDTVGGVVGSMTSSIEETSIVTNSYSAGAVNGKNDVGGVVGYANGKVTNCYSTSAVTGKNNVGGIVGDASFSRDMVVNRVTNCVALNPGVTATESDYYHSSLLGRITYDIIEIEYASYSNDTIKHTENVTLLFELSNNTTFSGLKGSYKNDRWRNKGSEKSKDAVITTAEIRADGTLSGRFTAANGWTVENGKLPGLLGKTVELPEHLK